MKPFLYVTSVNFVLKIAEVGSSRVALAGGASFLMVNGKDWEVRQSIRELSTNVKYRDIRTSRAYALPYLRPQSFPLTFTKDAPPARATRALPASAIFSTEVTYKKGFKNCPLCT